MLLELLKSGFGKADCYSAEEAERFGGVNLNCAERILYGANQVYNLGLTDEQLKVAGPFGGGMGIGSVCGTITGGLMVLSLLYKKRTEKQSPLKEDITTPFIKRVKAKMGGISCKYCKERYAIKEPFNCDAVIFAVAEVLDDTIAAIEAEKK